MSELDFPTLPDGYSWAIEPHRTKPDWEFGFSLPIEGKLRAVIKRSVVTRTPKLFRKGFNETTTVEDFCIVVFKDNSVPKAQKAINEAFTEFKDKLVIDTLVTR